MGYVSKKDMDMIMQMSRDQNTATRAMIIDKFSVLDQKIDSMKEVNEADHKAVRDHNERQNGTMKDHAIAIKELQKEPDYEPDQQCPAYRTDALIRKRWWVGVLAVGLLFAVMEWLYHDSQLLFRITELFQKINIFKP